MLAIKMANKSNK